MLSVIFVFVIMLSALLKPDSYDIVGFVASSRIVTIKIAKGSESCIDIPITSYDLLKIKNYVTI